MHVLLIKGQSQYGVLRGHIDALAAAFEARGDRASVVDATAPDAVAGLNSDPAGFLQSRGAVDLVVTINILGEFSDGAGRGLSKLTGAPHVVLYVDYPLCHLARLERTPRTTAILALDHSHVRVINSYFGPGRFAHVGFCPLAALGEMQTLPQSGDEFLASRPIEIFCPMTNYAPGEPPWRDYPEPTRGIIAGAVEQALATEWLPALEALDRWFAEHGLDISDPGLREQMAPVRAQSVHINLWVRDFRRQKLLAAAAKIGLPLSVDGKGFESISECCKNVRYLGCGDAAKTREQMARSRIVLNHNSNFGEGLHDRAPTAMLAGAVVASDTSRYYRDHYLPGGNIVLFRWQHLEDDLAAIAALVNDGDALLAIAKAGQQKALARDCWKHRIEPILAAAEAARAAIANG